MSVKIIAIVGAAAVAVAFGCGWWANGMRWEQRLTAYQRDTESAAAALTAKYRAQEKENAERLAAAIDARDKALADAVDLGSDLDRVRELANDYKRRMSAAGGGSCKPERERLARCVGLLEEGAGLAREGAGLSQRVAADKDALAQLVEKK